MRLGSCRQVSNMSTACHAGKASRACAEPSDFNPGVISRGCLCLMTWSSTMPQKTMGDALHEAKVDLQESWTLTANGQLLASNVASSASLYISFSFVTNVHLRKLPCKEIV